jgi:hypothetical protein
VRALLAFSQSNKNSHGNGTVWVCYSSVFQLFLFLAVPFSHSISKYREQRCCYLTNPSLRSWLLNCRLDLRQFSKRKYRNISISTFKIKSASIEWLSSNCGQHMEWNCPLCPFQIKQNFKKFSCYVCGRQGENYFLQGENGFLPGENCFLLGENNFLPGEIHFLLGENSFLLVAHTHNNWIF